MRDSQMSPPGLHVPVLEVQLRSQYAEGHTVYFIARVEVSDLLDWAAVVAGVARPGPYGTVVGERLPHLRIQLHPLVNTLLKRCLSRCASPSPAARGPPLGSLREMGKGQGEAPCFGPLAATAVWMTPAPCTMSVRVACRRQ